MRPSRLLKLAGILGAAVLVSGCVTYSQPRYGSDGVYYDQRHGVPRQVVFVDPMLYPFWSVDFFYFNRFHSPYRSAFGFHDPWFYRGPRWVYGHVWSHPVVYRDPPIDQRLWLMEQRVTSPRRGRLLQPGSEVELRHRLAEDRAAATSRQQANVQRSAVQQRQQAIATRPSSAEQASRRDGARPGTMNRPVHQERRTSSPPVQTQRRAPASRPPAVSRPSQQHQQRNESRGSPATRAQPTRERQIER